MDRLGLPTDAAPMTDGPPPTLAEVRETVRSLIAMMGDGGITELDLAVGRLSVRLRGGRSTTGGTAPWQPPASEGSADAAPPAANEHVLTAPMIGTFYASPTPGDPPFVRVGDEVEAGQVVGIIEAMKIMNEISADRSGTVAELLVANAQAVEYGSPLIRLVLPAEPPA